MKNGMENIKAYCIGGGIGSLAAAAFMIRDGHMQGSQITIFEKLPVQGGSLDGKRLKDGSYTLRGGRMLTTDHYECLWGLYEGIPSLGADVLLKPSADDFPDVHMPLLAS